VDLRMTIRSQNTFPDRAWLGQRYDDVIRIHRQQRSFAVATTTTGSTQGRESKPLCPFMASIRWLRWLSLLAAWRRREYILQVADSYRAALDKVQACFSEDGNDFPEADVTMAVKMGNNASLRRRRSEVDSQHPAAWLQYPSYLTSALRAQLARQMMQHQRAEHNIEVIVRERQRLHNRVPEVNVHADLAGLLTSPGNHLRRGVDPADPARWPDLPPGCDRKCSCPTAHVQNSLGG
jgi:hypothetical protein